MRGRFGNMTADSRQRPCLSELGRTEVLRYRAGGQKIGGQGEVGGILVAQDFSPARGIHRAARVTAV
jgi:hypothetical protein